MKYFKFLLPLLFIVLSCSESVPPKLELPSLLSDGMVLQQNSDVMLWGVTNPKQKITVSTTWGDRKLVKADKSGQWSVKMRTMGAGGPYKITIQAGDTSSILSDVYLGEVWLCSGQSNMEMTVAGWPPTDTILHAAKEMEEANYPLIRIFNVTRNIAAKPLSDCGGSWKICSPATIPEVSATAYFFGRRLHKTLDVPVGLITSSWGGTPAESWTPGDFLKEIPAYTGIIDSIDIARTQYDSLLQWMDQLPNRAIDGDDNNFYANMDYADTEKADRDYNDSDWEFIQVPSLWEKSRLANFDGIVWYRTRFNIPGSLVNKDMTLHLGPIDDMDATFINGQKIGEIMEEGRWKDERNYAIPEGLLTEGENILAVRVIDNQGGGGIYGSEPVYLSDNSGNTVMLDSPWKYVPEAEILNNNIFFYTEELPYDLRPQLKIPIGPYTSTFLYNAMIHPLIQYTIKGVIWYQGEANVGRGFEYRTLFPTMIKSWRSAWNQGDFPFYYVQIAPYDYWDEIKSPAAELREAQLMALKVPNTGMVVTMDIGNPMNIHPANKQEVGRRLALWAFAKDYGYDTLEYSGPLFKSISIKDNKAIIAFDHAENGLMAKGPLTYFEIAGDDQVYYPAGAVIEGNTVVVSSDIVPVPVAVRYGWSATAEPNLFNGAGLPASPFRTDNWKRLSE